MIACRKSQSKWFVSEVLDSVAVWCNKLFTVRTLAFGDVANMMRVDLYAFFTRV